MRSAPETRYVFVGPETWALIRDAYLSGLSASAAAGRYGVSVTALRRRAAREGWTKRAYAAALDPDRVRAAEAAFAARALRAAPGDPAEDAALEGWTAPLHIRAPDLARRALAAAAQAVRSGEGLQAARLARAASEIARLDGVLDWADEDVAEADARFEHNQATMRLFLREKALQLAQALAAGQPLPPEYEALRAAQGEGAA